MAVSGTINMNVSALEETASEGVETQRKISLSSAATFAAGSKVAVISGTCGTTKVKVDLLAPGYTAADGTDVTFTSESTISGIAFAAEPRATMAVANTSGDGIFLGGRTVKIGSQDGFVAMTQIPGHGGVLGGLSINVYTDDIIPTTSAYTVVVWGT